MMTKMDKFKANLRKFVEDHKEELKEIRDNMIEAIPEVAPVLENETKED